MMLSENQINENGDIGVDKKMAVAFKFIRSFFQETQRAFFYRSVLCLHFSASM